MMDDDEIPGETPMQRLLRLKKAAQAADAGRRGKGRAEHESAAAAKSASKSKPWMKR